MAMVKKDVNALGKWARVFYLFVNFAVWIFGLILIAVGGFLLQNLSVFSFVYSTSESELAIGCWVLIGLGCLVFLVGFNGVWACVRESVLWMKVYFVFMLLIMLGGFATGVLTLLGREQAMETVKSNMRELIKNEYGKGNIVDTGYDEIHQQQKCCGEAGPKDWADSYFTTLPENANLAVPVSCCVNVDLAGCNSGQPGRPDNLGLVFSAGCGDGIANFQSGNMTMLGLISLIMVSLETISLLLVCCVIGTRPAVVPPPAEDKEQFYMVNEKDEEDKL
ncbi:tetraspanin-11-like [Acanthaster planci]|uniref:Tetraspanin n=1 Tax=Acanthaster planci TaxID=133434 RepID=A0A8B7XQ41_ACAPL|nr:tetraspanin-11-like [Acanthaster planci]XP_022082938.1 tetraspanin-11-like [Acanthaster planci]